MARVVYRTRRPSSGRAPAALIVVPRDTSTVQASTAQQQFALWVQNQHNQLTALRDQEALQGLADGHTDAFLTYAKKRVGQAADDQERAYWQSLIERATAKIEDDTIAAAVNSGDASLEDLLGHVQDRMDALPGGQSNPQFPALLNQIATIKNSINARDFRNEMLTAQQAYINNEDKTQAKIDYAAKLNDLLYRAKDPTAQQTVLTQLQQVQTAIKNDQTLQRERELAVKVAQYHDHQISASDLQSFLAQRAESATTPAEAERYVTLAQQVETNERTRTSAAITAASRAGAAALRDALFGPEQNYLDAKANLQVALDRGVPSIEAVNIFKTAAGAYAAAIEAAAPHTSGTQLNTLLNDERTIATTVSELTKQSANKVVAEVQKQGASYQTIIDSNKAGTNDAEQESRTRFLWAQTLRDAANSPLLQGHDDQRSTIQKDLEVVLRAQSKEIADSSAVIAGTKPTKALTTQLPGLYKTYADQVAQNGGTPLTQQDWAQGLALGNLDRASAQATLQDLQSQLQGADPTTADDLQKQIAILQAVLDGNRNQIYKAVGAYVGNAIDGRNLLDFKRVRDAHNAEIDSETQRLAALTAPRGKDGSAAGQMDDMLAGALEANRLGLKSMSTQTSTAGAGPVPTDFTNAQRASDLGWGPSGGGGRPPGNPALMGDQAPQDGAPPQAAYTGDDTLPNDARIRELQTHYDASASLFDSGQSIQLPSWEIPSLPPEPAFDMTRIDPGFDSSSYIPPPLDFGAGGIDWSSVLPPPNWQTSAVEDPNSPEYAAAAAAAAQGPGAGGGGAGQFAE